ncbi:hypothetical protein C8A00DRAFT_37658 [Chaetomidium leptoderma]|uniref:Uncharacterized protein n=1 Tax=Chaetomidium leptoderma TaxID=669021 RepID=A0AAN6VE87_9PEZI|nr:hypothetical protein C8A00DRAFT_37658 [Chaetomidium leptoderma]
MADAAADDSSPCERSDRRLPRSVDDGPHQHRTTISSNHADALRWLRVYRLPKSHCLYVQWDLPSTQAEFTALASELGAGYDFVQSLSISWLFCKFRVRLVFVEHHNGLPFGRWCQS